MSEDYDHADKETWDRYEEANRNPYGVEPMSQSGYVHLDVDEIKRITEKAMLVRIEDEEHWLPLSQVADADDYKEGDTNATVSITEWIAKEKGLMP